MDEKQFKELDEKLGRVLRLLALNVVKNARSDEQVKLLSSAGFRAAEIAEMLGKKRNAVDQALHRLKQRAEETSKESSAEGGNEYGKKG